MSRIPDFATIDFAPAVAVPGGNAESWLTPEGIAVKSAYGPDDLNGIAGLDSYPGIAPYLRGPYPTMYVTQPRLRKIPTLSTAAISRPDRKAFRSRSIWRRTAATTPITRAFPATSAWPVLRSIPFTTCGRCSPASRSTR